MAKSTGRRSGTARRRTAGSNTTSSGARRGGREATHQPGARAATGRRSNERSGASKLASFLNSSLLRKIAAAGFASAAAALLYKKSDRTSESEDQGLAGETVRSSVAPAARAPRRTAAPKGQVARGAGSSTELGSAEEVSSAGPVRTRKKRSDAGSKHARNPDTSSKMAAEASPLVPERQSTDTGVIAVSADAAAPAQLQDDPPELEAQAHPS